MLVQTAPPAWTALLPTGRSWLSPCLYCGTGTIAPEGNCLGSCPCLPIEPLSPERRRLCLRVRHISRASCVHQKHIEECKGEHREECKGWRERGRETREGEASCPLTVSLASVAMRPGNTKAKVIRQSTLLPSVTGFQPSKSLWPTKAHLLLTESLLSDQ